MTQYDLFGYKAHNNTETSRSAFKIQQPKVKTLREKVHDLIKTQPSSNDQIADELDMVLSSVCARVRELQVLNFIEDSGKRVTTRYGRKAIVWQDISLKF
jgi:predicted Rossmann fold nucleotide-binding protein DprA/Smf involved in DNA uptake